MFLAYVTSANGGRSVRSRVVGMLRVQEIVLTGGLRSWTIVWPDSSVSSVHEEADRLLRGFAGEPGTQRTYAFLLVDHLRWLEREAVALDAVTLRDPVRAWASRC